MKRMMLFAAMVMSWCAMADTEVVDGIEWTFMVTNGEASVGSGNYSGARAVPILTLGDITIPAVLGGCPVSSIGDNAFDGCSGLTSVTIPSSVISIGYGVFDGCYRMTSIDVSKDHANYTSDEGVLFNKSMTELICFPKGKTGAYAIPNDVTSIGKDAFSNCSMLTDMTIPSSVTSIGDDAFSNCFMLMDVTISESVANIGECAFIFCSALTSITIPNSVTNMGGWAFCECSVLDYVDFEGAPPSGVSSASIKKDAVIRYNVAYKDEWLPIVTKCGWANATAYVPGDPKPNGGPYTETVDGIAWTYTVSNGRANVEDTRQIYPQSTTGDITIPFTLGGRPVMSVGDCALCGSWLTSVTMPEGVTSIGWGAFYGCSGLTSVTIPSSVTSIGDVAFFGCYGLTNLTIPFSVANIGEAAFENCVTLSSVDFAGAPPEGVTNACVNADAAIRYNVAYEDEWLPVIAQCGWTNATPYVPGSAPTPVEDDFDVVFVVPNGVSSMSVATYSTNSVYGRLPEARRDGFTFAGWYTALDGTNRVSAFSAVDPNVTALYARWVEDDASLYAQWEANRYSVSFNANGGEGEMAAQPFLYDQAQALNGNTFTKLGYTFKGWSTMPDGEVVYTNGVSVSNLTAEAGFAVALFAKWEKVIDVATDTIEEWVGYDLAEKFRKEGETRTQYRKRFEAEYGDDYAAAFIAETGKIGMDGTKLQVWHDYVAGTDPLDETSQFKATVTMEGGVPVVKWEPALNGEGVKDGVRIYKVLGAKTLGGGWTEVQSGHEADYNFFKVTVEMR